MNFELKILDRLKGRYDLKNVSTNASTLELSRPEDAIQAEGEEEGAREAWGGKLEFILTCVGYAVGLGNVWRFPYLCYKNGGGAFLIPYIIMLGLVGLPLFFMELGFGQFASLGPISIWTMNPMLKGLGYAMVIVSLLIGLYYNIIIAWCIYYFFASMTSKLPWTDCSGDWNTKWCIDDYRRNNTNYTYLIGNETKTPSEEYFYNEALGMSAGIEEGGQLQWKLALCLAAAWLIVFLVLIKGISSLGKVVYFTAIFPYVLLTIMLIRGVTLPGAVKGIEYYLKPDFARLADSQVWSDAAVQIFYSLSACSGGLIAMASYNKFNNNVYRDAMIVPFINCGTSVYSGLVIFSVLGFMAEKKGVGVEHVAQSGPGLVFVVYPEGLEQMPVNQLWSVLFFFMMMMLGFSSEFSIVECVFSALVDEFTFLRLREGRRGIYFRGILCLIFFLLGLPMVTQGGFYLFNLVDNYVGGFPLLVVGFFECISIQFVYGFSRFSDDIEMMIGRRPNIYWRITWCFFAPVLLFAIAVFKAIQYEHLTLFDDAYQYPGWATALGWLIVAWPVCFIPLWALFYYCYSGGYSLLKENIAPLPEWGPSLKQNRTGRYRFTPPPSYASTLGDIAQLGVPSVDGALSKERQAEEAGSVAYVVNASNGMANPGFQGDESEGKTEF